MLNGKKTVRDSVRLGSIYLSTLRDSPAPLIHKILDLPL